MSLQFWYSHEDVLLYSNFKNKSGHLHLFIFISLKFWYSHESVPCVWITFFKCVAVEKKLRIAVVKDESIFIISVHFILRKIQEKKNRYFL
jgi:hypothetical protein